MLTNSLGQEFRRDRDGWPLFHHMWGFSWEDMKAGAVTGIIRGPFTYLSEGSYWTSVRAVDWNIYM